MSNKCARAQPARRAGGYSQGTDAIAIVAALTAWTVLSLRHLIIRNTQTFGAQDHESDRRPDSQASAHGTQSDTDTAAKEAEAVNEEDKRLQQATQKALVRLQAVEAARKCIDQDMSTPARLQALILIKVFDLLRECEKLLPFLDFEQKVLTELQVKVPVWWNFGDATKEDVKKLLKLYMIRLHPDKWKSTALEENTALALEKHAVAILASQNVSAVYGYFKT